MVKRGKFWNLIFNKKAQIAITNKFINWILWILFFIAGVVGISLLMKNIGV